MARGYLIFVSGLLSVALVLGSYGVLLADGNIPPMADFSYSPILPYVGEVISFNGSASYDPDGFVYSYTWDFADGNVTVVSTPETTHAYLNPGEYNVSLLVTDSCLATNSTFKIVSVGTHVSASFFYSPLDPHVDELVTFDASDSTASDGAIISYSWDFDDGNETAVNTPIISHSYKEVIAYNVTLNVTSTSGEWDIESKIVNVTSGPPAFPKAIFRWLPTIPEAGQPVEFNASDSTPARESGEITSYSWDFGDGTTQAVSQSILTHVFQSLGIYNVSLTVTDSDGLIGVTEHSVPVIARPVADFFFSPKEPRVCGVVSFNGSGSDPRGGYIVSFEWVFGDDSTVQSGVEVSHRFRRMGEYVVSLNVTDSENLWDVKNVTVKVFPHIADLNEDGMVDILDLAIFAAAYGSFPDHERWNPKADIDQNSIVNILDGAIIAVSFNMCNPIDP